MNGYLNCKWLQVNVLKRLAAWVTVDADVVWENRKV